MLKQIWHEMRSAEWGATIPYWLVIVLGQLLALFLSHGQINQYATDSAANNQPDYNGDWWDYSGAWIAIFTIILTFSTVALWLTNWLQIRHARAEFNATHRPKIVIHSLEQPGNIEGNAHEKLAGANVAFFNEGVVPAKNITIDALIRPGNSDPEPGIAIPFLRHFPNAEPGGPHVFAITSDVPAMQLSFQEICGQVFGGPAPAACYCIGRVTYTDGRGTRRVTGFCWKWGQYKWERVSGSSYDYSY